MDINHLQNDEFLIECSVRSLQGTHLSRFTQLLESLKGEASHPVLIPGRAHQAALKQPKRELTLCANKIQSLQRLLVETKSDPKIEVLNVCYSRLIHVNNRLIRISSSPTYHDEALRWLQAGEKLVSFVNDLKNDSDNLDETLNELDNMEQMQQIVETLDPYDDFSEPEQPNMIPPSQPVAGPSNVSLQPVAGPSNVSPADQLATILSSPQGDEMLKLLDDFHKLATTPLTSNVKNSKNSGKFRPNGNKSKNSRNISFSNAAVNSPFVRNALSTSTGPAIRPSVPYHGSYLPPISLASSATQFSIPPSYPPSSHVPVAHNPPAGYPNPSMVQNMPPGTNHYAASQSQHCNPPGWNGSPGYNSYDVNSYSYNNRKPETWNLSFEGSKNDATSIDRFLTRVEKMATKNRVSPDKLVDYLSQLLKGDALEWYWLVIERHDCVTWPQIKSELLSRFQVRKSDDDIHRELSSRRQYYPRETFYEFYSSLLKLSLQLRVPLTDGETLRYLKCGMRPGLHLELGLQLNYINSVESLVKNCVDLESLWTKYGMIPESNLRSLPNTRHVNEMVTEAEKAQFIEHPSFDNVEASQELQALHHPVSGYKPPVPKYADLSQDFKPSISHQTSLQDVLCYNCRQLGHYANNCPLRKPDPDSPQNFLCQSCGKSENLMMGSRSSAPPLQKSNPVDNKTFSKKDPTNFTQHPRN